MVQGTSSDAGKSTLVTGLCRLLHRRGVRVAPFKPQNMSLNSAVTVDGGEIGRAQALQAQAAGIAPTSDLNPVLLKPNSDTGAQVIVQGRAIGNMNAREYHAYKPIAHEAVLASYRRLAEQFDAVIAEGAGSPAEINLRDRDIANMGFAEAVDCPVVLIADIDRGGVFAQCVGTIALLSDSEQARIAGFVINRFRGDGRLLDPGLRWLEDRTGKPVFGVLPYLHGLNLDAEDGIERRLASASGRPLRVLVPVLPHISNHTDFDPLRSHPQVDFRYLGIDEPPPPVDVVILGGSKNVRADLTSLIERGWKTYLARHLRYGGKLIGLCGGFQMLGESIADPLGIEGEPGTTSGFGWLEMRTELDAHKQLRNVAGTVLGSAAVTGYEIHAGITHGAALEHPLVRLEDGRDDGAISLDGQIAGSYLHGIFERPEACAALLRWMGLAGSEPHDYRSLREQSIERLADTLETHLNVRAVQDLL